MAAPESQADMRMEIDAARLSGIQVR